MDRHPIQDLMTTTMENLRDMVDVNTVIGEAIHTPDGSTVIPLSRVSFGFVSGGGEYAGQPRPSPAPGDALPFAGGAGAGVTVSPLGFLVASGEQVRVLPALYGQPVERIIEMIPQAMAELRNALKDEPSPEKAPEPVLP